MSKATSTSNHALASPYLWAYRKLLIAFGLLAATLLLGTTGYEMLEGWSFFDSLYMTVITIATVGYGETHPLSDRGRIFTMGLILLGSGILVYGVSALTAFIVEGDLTDALKRRKMKQRINALTGHYLICGDSNTGRYIIEELTLTHRPFVVIEKDAEKARRLLDQEIPCIEGDASSESILLEAGILRAAGLITTLHTDADNLFVVLTAHELNRSLRIISKAVEEESRHKLIKAGADSVVMPNAIGGLRMVSELVRPTVVTFLDVMLRDKDQAVRVEEIPIHPASPAVGKSLAAAGALNVPGVSLVALLRTSQPYQFNPDPATILQAGDRLIMLGESSQVQQLGRQLAPAS